MVHDTRPDEHLYDDTAVESIGAVLARLGRVDAAMGSVEGCDAWSADASRVAG